MMFTCITADVQNAEIATLNFKTMEVAYINSLIEKFWYVVLTNRARCPNFTDLLNLADSIIVSDNPENKKAIEELNQIRMFTHDEIKMPAASFELWLSRNWQSSINKELEFKDGKMLKLYDIARITDAVVKQICGIVTSIAKKYTLQIAYGESTSRGKEKDIWEHMQ